MNEKIQIVVDTVRKPWVKWVVILGVIGILAIWLLILYGRLSKAEVKIQESDFEQNQIRIERIYIPEKINELTTDELAKLLNNSLVE